MKYRKRSDIIEPVPPIVEAMQNVVGRAETISTWMKSHGSRPGWDGADFTIKTAGGKLTARRGDFIIMSTHYVFYPCTAEVFHKTYEPVGNLSDGPK